MVVVLVLVLVLLRLRVLVKRHICDVRCPPAHC